MVRGAPYVVATMRGTWSGDGPAVVLLHGQPGTAADWELVVPHLTGLRLLVPTRPGYDGSPAGGFGHNADALRALLDRTGAGKVVLAGHSWGGGVALRLALDAPDRVAALCLIGSVGSARAVTPTDRLLALPGVRRGSSLTMRLAGPRAARALAKGSGSRLDAQQHRDLRATMRVWARTGVWSSYAVEQRELVREGPALARRLPEVNIPTVVVVGRRDTIVAPRAQLDLADRLPRAEVRHLDAGHLVPLEDPAAVASAVRRAVELAG